MLALHTAVLLWRFGASKAVVKATIYPIIDGRIAAESVCYAPF